ncbi:hypothetical protein EJB05_45137, partial [Eragrostis curvula]
MAIKCSRIPIELLEPNIAYWRSYDNGKGKQEEITFTPLKEHGSLHGEVESSKKLLLTQSKEVKILGMEDMDQDMETNKVDLTLKL